MKSESKLLSFTEGPLREAFSYALKPDDQTVEMIDLGSSLGGMRETTAKIDGNSLISSCKIPSTNEVDMIATRTIDASKYIYIYISTIT